MNGKAPNSPATGSQVLVKKKLQPNLWRVIAEAEKLKAKGVDIADFGPGEPDFPTPEHIKKAAIRAIEQNFTKYTATGGIMPLREAICAWHKRELKSNYEPKECVVNVGGKVKRFGRFTGRRPDWKKAYVSLKAGQTIDLSGQAQA